MHDKFTDRVRRVMFLAREEAARLHHDYIGTEHLLLGIVREGEGLAATIVTNLGIDLDVIRRTIESMVPSSSGSVTIGEIPFTPRAKRVLELSVEEAKNLQHNYVGTEHLLLGLIREGEGIAARVLLEFGADFKRVKDEVVRLIGGSPRSQRAAKHDAKAESPALDQFGRDLTELARQGKLDPVIGREVEIERVIQVLCRRKKNNPVLIGEPGVGKTAIVEGLSTKIVESKVPELLRTMRVVALDLAAIVAGTKYRGQFEERLKAIINEIKEVSNIIIFIDELHTIVGAGGAEGAIDASNMLKPALARGELQCIGATTMDEYRKYIEKDGALERRFQPIMVSPPSVEETIEIIKGLRDKYEAHHRVRITDEAIVSAASLADRYIKDRYLPDKAIDVIDEAGARARLSVSSVPPDVRELEAKLANLVAEKESYIRKQDFENAARIRDHEREMRGELDEVKKNWKQATDGADVKVDGESVGFIVARMTGIPVVRIKEEESAKLLRMEDELRKRIVGQDEALTAVSKAIRRGRAGLKDPRRPIGSFFFLGPTGVGKTELARALTEFMFGDEQSLIRIDMSEYMEKFSVSRLVGAPPGYVGYEEGGQLTEKVRRRPYSVILLDEIEKAHPEVFNILLQVLEDGQLTDSFGRTVDFKNCVVIMTSNVGTRKIKSTGSMGFHRSDVDLDHMQMRDKVLEELKRTFNPEFLNRVDEIIVFRSLGMPEIEKIIEILLAEVQHRVKAYGLTLNLTSEAKQLLIERGFDPSLGARPLRRTIQRYLEDPLAEEVLKGGYGPGSVVKVCRKKDALSFECKASASKEKVAISESKEKELEEKELP
ncbi:MAG: ATP-dependent Clp protease ATP-binding subunit [bacterium]|jgi:ATP-dependent Clp protease ATP-binding subunit ClpC